MAETVTDLNSFSNVFFTFKLLLKYFLNSKKNDKN